MTNQATEFNFDALVGPTHNYAGLAQGNLASQQNRQRVSSPKRAALEGLAKMKLLADLGIPQVVLPPHERPDMHTLRQLGFSGDDATVLQKAAREAPQLLSACASASAMWAANAATVSPSADTADNLLHITPANLITHLHRSLETPTTAAILRAILPGDLFAHHDPLPAARELSDEGAANHSRLCADPGAPGLEIFTYGDDPSSQSKIENRKSKITFPPRQSLLASQTIARRHRLDPARTFFIRQNPRAIDAGVFHNDVIAVAHRHVFLYHELAYQDSPAFIATLRAAFAQHCHADLLPLCIPEKLLPLQDAVRSYLFNSQLLSLPDGRILLLAPAECQEIPSAADSIAFIRQSVPDIHNVQYVDVRQSMHNGGGPACLRLRVVLTRPQQSALHHGALLDPPLYDNLRLWIERHYRDELRPEDLADPQLLAESRTALDQLTRLLQLPALYRFQQRP